MIVKNKSTLMYGKTLEWYLLMITLYNKGNIHAYYLVRKGSNSNVVSITLPKAEQGDN